MNTEDVIVPIRLNGSEVFGVECTLVCFAREYVLGWDVESWEVETLGGKWQPTATQRAMVDMVMANNASLIPGLKGAIDELDRLGESKSQ